jgi:hypothetical protein
MKAAVLVALFVGAYAAEELMLKPLKLKKKENSFCMDGHIAPAVFLSGYQKAGSSSLWTDLMKNYNLAAAHAIGKEDSFREKEVSFFHNEDRYKKGHHFYLKHFPECKEYGAYQKVIDGSPNAIYQTDTNAPIENVTIHAIERMKKLYGDDLSKKIKFVIILRSPENRMESSYYHFHEGKYKNFDGYVAKTLEEAKNWTFDGGATSPSPNLYWPSMYARHLKAWLKEFDASQFALVTLQQYKEHPQKTLEFISKRLAVEPRDTPKPVSAAVENARNHPKMSAETRKKLQDFYAPLNKELADLVKEHQIGMGVESVLGKVPGVFLQTGEGDPEAIKDAFDENVHFMMPDVEEMLRKEYA